MAQMPSALQEFLRRARTNMPPPPSDPNLTMPAFYESLGRPLQGTPRATPPAAGLEAMFGAESTAMAGAPATMAPATTPVSPVAAPPPARAPYTPPSFDEWVARLQGAGAAVAPEPLGNILWPKTTKFGAAHPTMANVLDAISGSAAHIDPKGAFGGYYNRRLDAAEEARNAPLMQAKTGLELTNAYDRFAGAQADDARMAEHNAAQEELWAAQAERARREDTDQLNINHLRQEYLNLGSIPETQRTPAQTARLGMLKEMVGGSTGAQAYTPAQRQLYDYAVSQGYKGTLVDFMKEVANTYMEGRFVQTADPNSGQVTFTFPNKAGTPTISAGPGVVSPTAQTKIADATKSFEVSDAMLGEIEQMANDVITSEGMWDGAQQTLRGLGGSMPTAMIRSKFPREAAYNDTVEAFSSMMARAAGETGPLASSDTQRIIRAIPSIVNDPKSVAASKLKTMRRLYKTVVEGAIAAYSAGDVPNAQDFAGAGIGEGGILRDPDTGRRWVLQNGTPRPIILGD